MPSLLATLQSLKTLKSEFNEFYFNFLSHLSLLAAFPISLPIQSAAFLWVLMFYLLSCYVFLMLNVFIVICSLWL